MEEIANKIYEGKFDANKIREAIHGAAGNLEYLCFLAERRGEPLQSPIGTFSRADAETVIQGFELSAPSYVTIHGADNNSDITFQTRAYEQLAELYVDNTPESPYVPVRRKGGEGYERRI